MITKPRKERMHEYLVDILGGPSRAELRTMRVQDHDVRYVSLGLDQAIILVDHKLPAQGLHEAYETLRKGEEHIEDIGSIILKDGETFYSSAAHWANTNWRIIREYPDVLERKKIIKLRPEEVWVYSRNDGTMQYYQPKSARLDEGIMTFHAIPVPTTRGGGLLDYHVAPSRLKKYSQHYILNPRGLINEPVIFTGGSLVPKSEYYEALHTEEGNASHVGGEVVHPPEERDEEE